MQEIWMPIGRYPGYEASNLGRVKSVPRLLVRSDGQKSSFKEKLLTSALRGDYPYYRVMLSIKNKHYYVSVHRLIAFAFFGEPPNSLYEVNHKDGNKLNNEANNLEWMTHRENSNHAVKVLKSRIYKNGEENHCSKLTNSQIKELRSLYKAGKFYQHDLAAKFGITREHAGRIIRGELRFLDGFDILVPKPKLSKIDVVTIRELFAEGKASKRELATAFDVKIEQIRRIILRLRWRDI